VPWLEFARGRRVRLERMPESKEDCEATRL
jgi:hypothetical protein